MERKLGLVSAIVLAVHEMLANAVGFAHGGNARIEIDADEDRPRPQPGRPGRAAQLPR
jgi:anti-sigma regulatory factor (Ser/Thr protein kinase)